MTMKILLYAFFLIAFVSDTTFSVPLSEFFPYGTIANDQLFPANDDGSTNASLLPRLFPYFNNNHRQIYLANNGLFSFLGPISQFVPTPFPLGDGRRLIAGFWSDIDTRGNIVSGNQVYYQIYANQSNSTDVFNKATTYVQQYFPIERSFSPSMIITGTWYRVGAYPRQTSHTNTFQIVLATDEIRSFAFLLYHDLQWTTTSTTGNISGQAGFNAGDGVIFQMLPYSRTNYVNQLVNISNVNVPGLFVFRIDSDTVSVGGCGNSSSLIFRPLRGSQLGSTAITIQGPCFANRTHGDIKCRFGQSMIVDAIAINNFEAICLTPSAPLPISVNVYVSIDRGINYQLFPYVFTYTPIEYGVSFTENAQVTILNRTDIIITTGSPVILGWYLSETTMNWWPNDTVRLEVQMWSVTLNTSNGGITENTYTVLQTNLIPILGFQSVSITIPSIENSIVPSVFFRIVARDTATNLTYMGLNSPLLILLDTSVETSSYCYTWSETQPSPTTWNDNLLACPLTLTQARVARCCYEPDSLCTENSESSTNCQLHRGRSNYNESSAVACYLSRTTNQWNAGAECCYDIEGQLITSGLGAGTDDRYRPSTYPVLHFFEDTLPYLACCIFTSNEESCWSYFNYRPPRRGSNFRNSWGWGWGDPHFSTLDSSSYTFNGYGEYTYLAMTDSPTSLNTAFDPSSQYLVFEAQLRTTPITSLSANATSIRGLAAKSNHLQAQRMSVTVSRREMLVVRRGNETLDLDTTNDDEIPSNNSLVLFFPEMTLERNQSSGTLTLSWFLGVSIQITPISVGNFLVFNLGIAIDGSFQNRTFGLLGLYDNNPDNDLRAKNGTIIGRADTLTLEQIHRQFGQTWSINPSRSLFYYESDDAALNYTNQNNLYIPSFLSPQPPNSQLNATLALCNIDPSSTNQSTWTLAQQTCFYDVSVTNDSTLGQASTLVGNNLVEIAVDQRYPPEFNSQLPLVLTVNDSVSLTIDFTATSPYNSNIHYNLVRGPSMGIFNDQTAVFYWQEPQLNQSNTIIRVTAQDTQYNLLSTHEVTVRVVSRTTSQAARLSLDYIFTIIYSYALIRLIKTF